MGQFKNILAIDSALQGCGAGVCVDGKISAHGEAMNSGQAERLMPIVQDVLQAAGLKFFDLHAIVTTVGPGAFTGLRIGLSTAKSLGLALEIPVFGVSTLQTLASQYTNEKKPDGAITVILETKRTDFYFQIFSKGAAPLSEAKALPAEEIAGILKTGDFTVIGDGTRFTGAAFENGYALPDAA
jgi:tRNA threonylcarbamoyladenosine biosynthesis protein TsaB